MNALALAAPLLVASFASAQCGDWVESFPRGNVDGPVACSVVYDDGNGPRLYVGGDFRSVGTVPALGVAAWDGHRWSALGAGLDGAVSRLLVFDDGGGPRLYATGTLQRIGGVANTGVARWDGSSWTAMSAGLFSSAPSDLFQGTSLAAFDSGHGPELYVGAWSTQLNGGPCLFRWTGSTWAFIGGPNNPGAFDGPPGITDLAVHDDGSGPRLFVVGDFDHIGATPASNAAIWNGTSWTVAAASIGGSPATLAVHDFGAGPRLFAGGSFTAGPIAGRHVVQWNGAGWSPLGSDVDGHVTQLASIPANGGVAGGLHAVGNFTHAGSATARGIARWDGNAWTALDAGNPFPRPMTLGAFDDGSGAKLYAGAGLGPNQNGGAFGYLNGTSWRLVEPGNGLNSFADALASFDDDHDGRPALFAAGSSILAGSNTIRMLARWDADAWSSWDAGFDGDSTAVRALDDGSGAGPTLLVGGYLHPADTVAYTNVLRWNGSGWNALGAPFANLIDDFAIFDDGTGPKLFAAAQPGLHRWDGTSWSEPLVASGSFTEVKTLHVFDDGSGPALYIGGTFSRLGGVDAPGLARWNGTSVDTAGLPPTLCCSYVDDMAVFDDGTGPALYAAGSIRITATSAGVPLARWDGVAWTAIATTITSTQTQNSPLIRRMCVGDDGSGPALFVTGRFDAIDGAVAHSVARWNSTGWSALGAGLGLDSGFGATGFSIVAHDAGAGAGPELFVGGAFANAGTTSAGHIARWSPCGGSVSATCVGDGTGTACPCGNSSAPGSESGCLNSFGTGAKLLAQGRARVSGDTLTLIATGLPPTPGQSPTFTQGTRAQNGGAGTVFGDGLRCVGGSQIRLGSVSADQGQARFGFGTGTLPVSVRGQLPAGVESTRYYQVFYRNAFAFCTSATFNLSNGLSVVWEP